MNLKERLNYEVSRLYPGYFAFVMAINILGYVVLWFLTLVRLFRYFPEVIADITSHVRGPGFFTLVAGTCIFGNQFMLISKDFTIAFFLLILGIILWFIMIYGFFTSMIVQETKPTLKTGIHGGWFIAVVATQSVSVLVALVASGFSGWREHLLFISLFLVGSILYMVILTLYPLQNAWC